MMYQPVQGAIKFRECIITPMCGGYIAHSVGCKDSMYHGIYGVLYLFPQRNACRK